jgi:simple sugar transport system ATP-binding protein
VGATEFIRKQIVDLSVPEQQCCWSRLMNEVIDSATADRHVWRKIVAYFEDASQLDDEVMGEYMLGLKHQTEEEIAKVCYE